MTFKQDLQEAGDHIKDAGKHLAKAGEKAVEKIKDTASEASHRATAEAERRKREELGDYLTPGEKAKSVANEAKHTVQAKADQIKKNMNDA